MTIRGIHGVYGMVALLGPRPRCGYVRSFRGRSTINLYRWFGRRASVNIVIAFVGYDSAFDIVADFGGDRVEEGFVSVGGYG